MTHEQLVLKHLLEFGSITTWEAYKKYGNTRLSAYILNLRKKGYEIKTEYVTRINRHGNSSTYAKYILIKNI
jgi:hypothetical protein